MYYYYYYKAVSLLSKFGVGISYDRVTGICNSIANAISQNIRKHDVYVPPGLLRNKRIRASLDNFDKNVDTPNRKGTFHGTAHGVSQPLSEGETVVDPV